MFKNACCFQFIIELKERLSARQEYKELKINLKNVTFLCHIYEKNTIEIDFSYNTCHILESYDAYFYSYCDR